MAGYKMKNGYSSQHTTNDGRGYGEPKAPKKDQKYFAEGGQSGSVPPMTPETIMVTKVK